MSWTKEDRNFKKGLNKRLTDTNGKYYFNEIGDLTQNVHVEELWLDPIPVQPNGSTDTILLYTDFELTVDNTVPNKQTWYAVDGGVRLKGWIADKYDNVDLSDYQVVIKTYDGTRIPLGPEGKNWIFDYETGILTFETAPPSTYYSGGNITITGYRYVGRKGIDTSIIKRPCRIATTSASIDSDWSWASTNGGEITITKAALTIDGVEISTTLNPSDAPAFNMVADRILVKDYTGVNQYKNGIYVLTAEGSVSGSWVFTRADDFDASDEIYPDCAVFVQEGTENKNSLWSMGNYGFTTMNDTSSIGYISFTRGLSNSKGTPNYVAKFDSTGVRVTDSILEEVNGEYIYIHGSILSPYKNFIIEHPNKDDHYLIYGCLEGPEHGVYFRGTVEGNGEIFVELPDYWGKLCNNYSVVGLTPYGKYSLYIREKQKNGFTVAAHLPFWRSKQKYKFDYLVLGERAPIKTEVPVWELSSVIRN